MEGSISHSQAEVPALNDPDHVHEEYSDEAGLAARAALWRGLPGPQPLELALERVVALAPARVLEVGCGRGEFAASLAERGVAVIALDQSERMVELTAALGVDARVGDVQTLPFADGTFDVAVANYMLYHVADLDRGLSELARVLRHGGALVATTNSDRQLAELWRLVGRTHPGETGRFDSDDGAARLGRHFARVVRLDVTQRFLVSEDAARDYIRATRFRELAARLPALPDGLSVTAAGTVFLAADAPA